jgi:hypothetical protein
LRSGQNGSHFKINVELIIWGLHPVLGPPFAPQFPKISLERFQNFDPFRPDDDRLITALSHAVFGHGDRVG